MTKKITTETVKNNAPERKKKLVVHTMKSDSEKLLKKGRLPVRAPITKTKPRRQETPHHKLEQKAEPKKPSTSKQKKNVPLIVLSVSVASLLSLFGFLVFLILTRTNTPPPNLNIPRSFVTADKQAVLVIKENGPNIKEQITDLKQNLSTAGSLQYLPIKIEYSEKQPYFASSADFFSLVSLAPPDGFVNTLKDRWNMYAYYREGGMDIILVFETNDYSRALADLFSWEKRLGPRLLDFIGAQIAEEPSFRNKVIQNIDVRIASNKNATLQPNYAIFTGKLIILSTSEPAMRNILERMIAGPLHF